MTPPLPLRPRSGAAIAVLLLLGGLAAAAGGLSAAAQTRAFPIVGTGDGIDMLRAVAAAHNARTPGLQIEVPASIGSGGGIASVGSGKAPMGRVARPLKKDEDLAYVPIARIPSAIFANADAGVQALGHAQLAAIFRGDVTNWAEVGGADLRIRVVRREEQDSTLGALRAAMPGWAELKITERSKMAATTQEAIASVAEVPGAIGFGPFSRRLPEALVVLSIDGQAPVSDAYPASVELALIHRRGEAEPAAANVLAFARGPEARAVYEAYGAVPVVRTED